MHHLHLSLFLFLSDTEFSNNNSSSFQASRICVNVEEKRKHHLSGEPNSWQCKLKWKWWDKTLQFYTNQPEKAYQKETHFWDSLMFCLQPDASYHLEPKENGNNLVISLAELSDEGKWDWARGKASRVLSYKVIMRTN